MVEKNTFLIFNQVVSELYRCQTYACLERYFLPMLKLLIPAPYLSILRSEERGGQLCLTDPLCLPAEFAEAERNYIRYAEVDHTGWVGRCREATLIRESDLVKEHVRLGSTVYQKCYQPFDIYDGLFYAIVAKGHPLGVLSLFRCREDGPFTDQELFLLSSVGTAYGISTGESPLPQFPAPVRPVSCGRQIWLNRSGNPAAGTADPVSQQPRDRRDPTSARLHPAKAFPEHVPQAGRHFPLGGHGPAAGTGPALLT